MKFPTLYKKTNTGAIQFWDIEALCLPTSTAEVSFTKTTYGQLGTDNPQTTSEIIKNGKNIGKSNETSPWEQAELEAKAKWEKQLKKGYVESIEAAKKGELDEIIEGGISPMLAHTFAKQGRKIQYPAYAQKKYDGTRMIAILKDGHCTLWSRTRKPIHSLPHIVAEIENRFRADIILDGECYNHAFKDNFEHIIHLVRQQEPDDECTDVQFHIYDTVNDDPFEKRIEKLQKAFTIGNPKFNYLVLADTFVVENEDQVTDYFNLFRSQGYEGAILRNAKGLYLNKRSCDLIKVKEMQDEEFDIVDIEEGRGKLAGHVGAFICQIGNQTFKAKMSGSIEKLKEYFENPTLWKNQRLTVQYQELTSYGIPRFPVGVRIRTDL